MKRFVLILSVLLLTNLSANAIYMRSVGGVGRPTHVMGPSGQMRSINNFGSNAIFLKQPTVGRSYSNGAVYRGSYNRYAHPRYYDRFAHPRYYDRYARPHRYYYENYNLANNNSVSVSQATQVSRFDKNYKISTAKKSYTRNGVTYFE